MFSEATMLLDKEITVTWQILRDPQTWKFHSWEKRNFPYEA
jgi:hypothetical protein